MIARLRFVQRVGYRHVDIEIDGEPAVVDAVVAAIRKVKALDEQYEEK